MKTQIVLATLGVGLALSPGVSHGQSQPAKSTRAATEIDRTVLPIAEPIPPLATELDARNAKAPPRFEVKPPKGAPNVIVFLIDDMGFGHPTAFGGDVPMPTLDRLAGQGLRYNRFHTTALCAPTRMALLTGRNHHSANTGSIMEVATAFPGNTGMRPQNITPLAETLRQNGYSTAAFGKYHETPAWEVSVSGPFDRWPTRSGFDKWYGFFGSETNQYFPMVYDGMVRVEVDSKSPDYHFTTDMTNHAIKWLRTQHALTPDKPFFAYVATAGTHAPHHVSKEWIAKFKGRYDGGWDKYREETFARQKKMGIIPENTKLADKPPAMKDWDKLSADEKRLFARQMEVFAAFAAMTDYEIGRIVQAIDDLGELDNTLIMYIAGDNGASAEGGMVGTFNEMTYMNGVQDTVPDMLKMIDKWGGPETAPHMAAGWAQAGNTPFMWPKQVASNFGGTRNGLVVSWPARIKGKGEIRSQFSHVIDIAPTVLDAAGIPQPRRVNGIVEAPIEGVSMMYSFDDAKASERHKTQYFEVFGNRAIYHDGWFAGTVHKAPWEAAPRRKLAEDVWELYNVSEDFSQSNDLAAANPKKLKELQALFMKEAQRYRVLPIDDRVIERFDAASAGRPDLMAGRKSLTVYEGMAGMAENAFINVKNQSITITADIEIPAGGANGVILAQGGRFGGWSLYVKDGKPAYTYNFVGLAETTVNATEPLAPGKATIRLEFAYDGNGRGKGGTSTLYVNGKNVGSGRIERTQAERVLRGRLRRCGCRRGYQRELRVQGTRQQVHRQDREGSRRRQVSRTSGGRVSPRPPFKPGAHLKCTPSPYSSRNPANPAGTLPTGGAARASAKPILHEQEARSIRGGFPMFMLDRVIEPVLGPTGLDGVLSDEETSIRDAAHRFAEEVMRPIGQKLDVMSAEDVVAADSPLWQYLVAFRDSGLMDFDTLDGLDAEQKSRMFPLIFEELGWGDSGLAILALATSFPALMVHGMGNAELKERFMGAPGCWIATQPDRGSDVANIDASEVHPGSRQSRGNLSARLVGDEYVINGQSSAWITGAPIAQSALAYLPCDYGNGLYTEGGGLHHVGILIPFDLAGREQGQAAREARPAPAAAGRDLLQRSARAGAIRDRHPRQGDPELHRRADVRQHGNGDDLHRRRARRLRARARVCARAQAGRDGDRQSPVREAAAVRHVAEARGRPRPRPPRVRLQLQRARTARDGVDHQQDFLHADGARSDQRGDPDLRRQRADP